MTDPILYNINLFDRNILMSQMNGIEKEKVYSSIPVHIFQTRGWLIQSLNEVNKHLEMLGENDSYQLAYNLVTASCLTVTRKNPEHVNILIPASNHQLTGAVKRSPSASNMHPPPLPLSEDEADDTNGKSNPTILCFDRAYRTLRKYLIYFTETYIISSRNAT
jgi:hypothetical protein